MIPFSRFLIFCLTFGFALYCLIDDTQWNLYRVFCSNLMCQTNFDEFLSSMQMIRIIFAFWIEWVNRILAMRAIGFVSPKWVFINSWGQWSACDWNSKKKTFYINNILFIWKIRFKQIIYANGKIDSSCMCNDVNAQILTGYYNFTIFFVQNVLMYFTLNWCYLDVFLFWQGKGLMNTYWLTCREGPLKKREEISWFADIEPVFMKNLQTSLHEVRAKSRKSVKL